MKLNTLMYNIPVTYMYSSKNQKIYKPLELFLEHVLYCHWYEARWNCKENQPTGCHLPQIKKGCWIFTLQVLKLSFFCIYITLQGLWIACTYSNTSYIPTCNFHAHVWITPWCIANLIMHLKKLLDSDWLKRGAVFM